MIVYETGIFGVRHLLRVHGSAVYKTLLPTFFSTMLVLVYTQAIHYTINHQPEILQIQQTFDGSNMMNGTSSTFAAMNNSIASTSTSSPSSNSKNNNNNNMNTFDVNHLPQDYYSSNTRTSSSDSSTSTSSTRKRYIIVGNPYLIDAFVAFFALLLTFRLNHSYNRYWECATTIHMMMSKWLDAAMLLSSLHYQSQTLYSDIIPPNFAQHAHILGKRRNIWRKTKKQQEQQQEEPSSSVKRSSFKQQQQEEEQLQSLQLHPLSNTSHHHLLHVQSSIPTGIGQEPLLSDGGSILGLADITVTNEPNEATIQENMIDSTNSTATSTSAIHQWFVALEQNNKHVEGTSTTRNNSGIQNEDNKEENERLQNKDERPQQQQYHTTDEAFFAATTDTLAFADKTIQQLQQQQQRKAPPHHQENQQQQHHRRQTTATTAFELTEKEKMKVRGRKNINADYSVQIQEQQQVELLKPPRPPRPQQHHHNEQGQQQHHAHHRRNTTATTAFELTEEKCGKSINARTNASKLDQQQQNKVKQSNDPVKKVVTMTATPTTAAAWSQSTFMAGSITVGDDNPVIWPAVTFTSEASKTILRDDSISTTTHHNRDSNSSQNNNSNYYGDDFPFENSGLFLGRRSSSLSPSSSFETPHHHKTTTTSGQYNDGNNNNNNNYNLPPSEPLPPSLFLQEVAHLVSLLNAVAMSTLRNDIEYAESPLIPHMPNQPWPPVDPDLLSEDIRGRYHQNSGIRQYLYYSLGLSRSALYRTLYNAARPMPVLGGVSDDEIRFLQQARGPYAKVALCSMWLQEMITREHLAGSTGTVHPAIVNRVFLFLSEGMNGYNQSRKTAYIPFPFPHGQLTSIFTLAIIVVLPFLYQSFVTSLWFACLLNFATVLCFLGMHEVARELENPFQNVPNDIPLVTYQAQFNEALLVMYAGYHPDSWCTNNSNKQ